MTGNKVNTVNKVRRASRLAGMGTIGYTPRVQNEPDKPGVAEKPPFFIVGCPRSGTTLLTVLIDAHPAIAIPPESFVFERFGDILDCYGDLSADANLRTLAADLLRDERIKDWELGVGLDEFIPAIKTRSARGAISALFELFARKRNKTRWGDKTPQHAMYLPEIRRTFPDARLIHLVRDGRDVAESLSRIYIGPKSMYGIAKRWRDHVMAFHDFCKTLPAGEYLEIKYEDLVANPRKVQQAVFDFIGEDISLVADTGKELPDSGARRQATGAVSHHSGLNKSISGEKIGIFKTRFSQREIEIFELVADEALKAYGYELVSSQPRPITMGERLAAGIRDGFVRYQRKLFRPQMTKHLGKEFRLVAQRRFRRALRRTHCACSQD